MAEAPPSLAPVAGELTMVLSRGRQFQLLRGAKSHGVSLKVTVAPSGTRATSIEVPCAQGEPTWDAPLAPLDVPDICVQVGGSVSTLLAWLGEQPCTSACEGQCMPSLPW